MIAAENRPPFHGDPVQMAKQMSRGTSSHNDEESLFTPVMDFRKLMAFIGAFYWLIMTVIVVPTATVASFFVIIPITLFSIKLFNKVEHVLCNMVNELWTSAGQYTGLVIEEYGDDITKIVDKRALFIANHLGLVDHFCLMTAFHNKPPVTGRYLWVIYNIWQATPLGAMWATHGNFFINGGASKRAGILQQFRGMLAKNFWKFDYGWVIMYPEGSRLFIIKNIEKKWAEKNGIEPFKNCAHPRSAAAHAVMSVCGPSDKSLTQSNIGNGPPIEYVIDCTLGYPKGKVVGLGDAMLGDWPGSDSRVAMHYKIHKTKPEWSNEETLKQWLYEQYEKKDKLLEDYYRTGHFPGEGRLCEYNIYRNVLVQIFWIVLCYVHYTFWLRPLGLYLISFFF